MILLSKQRFILTQNIVGNVRMESIYPQAVVSAYKERFYSLLK